MMVGQERFSGINIRLTEELAKKKVLIVVHRGSNGGSVIENTIPAYVASYLEGADLFECDIVSSTDGVLYTCHDGFEKKLFGEKNNIRDMTSSQIDALLYHNWLGNVTPCHVQRFEEVLNHFRNGELFNIDRAWNDLERLDSLMRKYPHAIQQAIIKTPVEESYLEFFRNCSAKYMYMPICSTMEEVRLVLKETEINMVGVEMLFQSTDSEMFDRENIQWLKEQGLLAWANAIDMGSKHNLSAGHTDTRAISEAPDVSWGKLMERGYNVIQTDWPSLLSKYRKEWLKDGCY